MNGVEWTVKGGTGVATRKENMKGNTGGGGIWRRIGDRRGD